MLTHKNNHANIKMIILTHKNDHANTSKVHCFCSVVFLHRIRLQNSVVSFVMQMLVCENITSNITSNILRPFM